MLTNKNNAQKAELERNETRLAKKEKEREEKPRFGLFKANFFQSGSEQSSSQNKNEYFITSKLKLFKKGIK